MSLEVNSQSMVECLQLCGIKNPRTSHQSQERVDAQWKALNYPSAPVYEKVLAEYDAFAALLRSHGVELIELPADESTSLDSVYTHDPFLVSKRGLILCQMGKEARKTEPEVEAAHYASLGIPILGRLTGTGTAEGGDMMWFDERTLVVGQGYRTNAEGIRQLRELLGDLIDELYVVPLPHWNGPADCMHLLSFISPLDHKKAVVYSRIMPVPFREWLIERGVELIEVPDAEYDTFACNVLPVAPGKVIALEGNPVTRQRMEAAGVEVQTYPGWDLCIKGGGGPTCLTRPLLRKA